MTYAIPAELYNGLLHVVPFDIGPDFVAKWEALRADGFTVQINPGFIAACKIMCGEPTPPMAA